MGNPLIKTETRPCSPVGEAFRRCSVRGGCEVRMSAASRAEEVLGARTAQSAAQRMPRAYRPRNARSVGLDFAKSTSAAARQGQRQARPRGSGGDLTALELQSVKRGDGKEFTPNLPAASLIAVGSRVVMGLAIRRTEIIHRAKLEWRRSSRLYYGRLVVVHVELSATKTRIVGACGSRRVTGSIERTVNRTRHRRCSRTRAQQQNRNDTEQCFHDPSPDG